VAATCEDGELKGHPALSSQAPETPFPEGSPRRGLQATYSSEPTAYNRQAWRAAPCSRKRHPRLQEQHFAHRSKRGSVL